MKQEATKRISRTVETLNDLNDMDYYGSDKEEDQQQSEDDTSSGAHPHAPIGAQESAAEAVDNTTSNVAGQEDGMVEDEPAGG